jgi:hypothetical protein
VQRCQLQEPHLNRVYLSMDAVGADDKWARQRAQPLRFIRHIKVGDIDAARMSLRVEQGKGARTATCCSRRGRRKRLMRPSPSPGVMTTRDLEASSVQDRR